MRTNQLLRLLIAFLFVALAISIYFNLRQTESPAPPKSTTDNNICQDYSSETPATLKTTLISDMVERYRNTQLTTINTRMSGMSDDAHSVWFDLQTLKKFIYHIENNVMANDPGKLNQLGLRMYYGAYPSNTQFTGDLSGLNPTYEFRHTLVMIPTINNSSVGDVDFNPTDPNSYGGYISMPKDNKVRNDSNLLADYQLANYFPMALTNTPRLMGQNHGSLIPPGSRIVEGF